MAVFCSKPLKQEYLAPAGAGTSVDAPGSIPTQAMRREELEVFDMMSALKELTR